MVLLITKTVGRILVRWDFLVPTNVANVVSSLKITYVVSEMADSLIIVLLNKTTVCTIDL